MIEADSSRRHFRTQKLVRFGLTTPDALQLSKFYQEALGFRKLETGRRSGHVFEQLMGVPGGASAVVLGLGAEVVELLQFDRPGRPYPAAAASSDLCFQHFAIVVADMRLAYQRLVSIGGWTAISFEGPQQLPASSGGVIAFKFRDPDGHPLELLAFPDGQIPEYWKLRADANRSAVAGVFLGIDHSAISVAHSPTSIAFYEGLGLHVAARSLNSGPEQEWLDAVSPAQVEVTSLEPMQSPPHVELLCYRSVTQGENTVACSNDVAATRLIFEADGDSSESPMAPQGLIDPDGHHLVFSAASNVFSTVKTTANAGSSPAFVKPEQPS